MRILIVVASLDEAICRLVESRQGLLVPESFRGRDHRTFGQFRFQLVPLPVKTPLAIDDPLKRLDTLLDASTKGVVLVADRRLEVACPPLTDLYFVNEFDQHGPLRSPQNFLSALLSRVLRDFGYLLAQFSAIKSEKILRLPIRNFIADEIDVMRAVCRRSIDTEGFPRRLDTILAKFRDRQHPKRKSGYQDAYLVDDRAKHFRLGLEHHAHADTGPPHTRLCRLSNGHRFGCGFKSEQHYNVSMERDRMTGTYPDCHGVNQAGEARTHLNMFSNDFF